MIIVGDAVRGGDKPTEDVIVVSCSTRYHDGLIESDKQLSFCLQNSAP